jgi:hypothetical protein
MTSQHLWLHAVGRSQRACGALVLALVLMFTVQPALLAAPLSDTQPAPRAEEPPDEAVPAYVGLDNVHVRYTYKSSCTTCKRELQALMPDGTIKVLTDKLRTDPVVTGQFSGSEQHVKLPPETYGYRIMETREADGVIVNETITRYAEVDGATVGGPSVDGTVGGTLLYDEYLGQEFGCRTWGLTVSDGVDLTLGGAT